MRYRVRSGPQKACRHAGADGRTRRSFLAAWTAVTREHATGGVGAQQMGHRGEDGVEVEPPDSPVIV